VCKKCYIGAVFDLCAKERKEIPSDVSARLLDKLHLIK
jgi:hypothetical protein